MAASLLSFQALVLTDSLSKKAITSCQGQEPRRKSGPKHRLPHPQAPNSNHFYTPLCCYPNQLDSSTFLPFGLKYVLTSALQLGHHFLSHLFSLPPLHCSSYHFHSSGCSRFFYLFGRHYDRKEQNTPGYKYNFCYSQTVILALFSKFLSPHL